MPRPTLQTEATYLADGRTAVWRVPFPWRTPGDVGVKVVDSAGLETVLAVGRDCMLRGFDVFTFVPAGRTVKIWLKADVSEILNSGGAPLPGPEPAFPWTPPCPPAVPAPAGGEAAEGAESPAPVYGGAHPGPCGCRPGQEAPAPQPEARYYADGRTARWHVPFAWSRTTDVAVKVVDGEGVEHPLVDGTDYLLAGQFVYAFVPEGRTVVVYATVPVDGEVPVPSQPPADPCARLVPPPLDPSVAWLLASVQEVRKMQDGGIQMFWTAAGEAVEDCKAAVLEEKNAAATSAEAAAGSAASAAGSAETAETATHYLFNHGVLGFQTKALLDADLDHDANALAFVTNDPAPANNNWYIKLGASGTGSWQASDFNPATSAEADALEAGKADKVDGAAAGSVAMLDASGNLADSAIASANVALKTETAVIEASVAALSTGKADKAADAVEGNFAGLDEHGNLTDSGRSPVDITALESGKANKVSEAAAGDMAVLDASGDLVDSGVKPGGKADKVADATEGNFAGLDEYGNLTDSGRSPADITALEEAVESLEDRKADKFIPAEAGNLAKLDSTGNLRDSGRSAEDFTPLLTYANGEAQELVWQNRMAVKHYREWGDEQADRHKQDMVKLAYASNEAIELVWQNRMAIARYNDWLNEETDRHRRDMDMIAQAGLDARATVQRIRSDIDAFDESCARSRLQQRLFDGTNPASGSKPVLFIVSGQSNANGTGEYGPFDHAENCGQFWSWSDGANQLKPIIDPLANNSPKPRGSQWPAFARLFFALTGRKIIILNIAAGGSSVVGWGTTGNTWADNGYGVLRAMAQSAWNGFSAAVSSDSYDLGAILWLQGETDANNLYAGRITAEQYRSATLDVLEWTRSLVNEEACPVLNCMIGYSITALEIQQLKVAYKSIQQIQAEIFNSQNALYNISSMAPCFANAWEEFMYGGIHYGPIGYQIVGSAYARAATHYLNL